MNFQTSDFVKILSKYNHYISNNYIKIFDRAKKIGTGLVKKNMIFAE